jgi:hypothetical protein
MKCALMPEGDSMRLECETDFEVVNPTNEIQRYSHAIQFEQVENPTVHSMNLVSVQENYSVAPALAGKADDPVVLEAKGREVKIMPASQGITYRFGAKCSMIYPKEFFYALHVGHPTIGITVEVVPPTGFDVTASPTPTCTKNLWIYEKLFMPGEHVDIRWQQKSAALATNGGAK